MYNFLSQHANHVIDHSSKAVNVHRAAFSGGLLAAHQQPILSAAAEKFGFRSCYWISRAQATKRNVTLKANVEPTLVSADAGGVFSVELASCDCIDKDDLAYFFDSVDPRGLGSTGPIYFRADKWRLVSDRTSVQKLHEFREQNSFLSNRWIEKGELTMLNLKLKQSQFPPTVTIDEGVWTQLFNADQTETPSLLTAENPAD